MRPSDKLITAWHAYLKLATEAEAKRLKAGGMFKVCQSDVQLYNRANELAKESITLANHANIEFRKALKAEWGKRYRIEWLGSTTCNVYVWAPRSRDEQVLVFNKSSRIRKNLH